MPEEQIGTETAPPTKFSIIVPVRNVEATVRRTIRSILDQDWPAEPEIIVVDGASTDGTLEAIQPLVTQTTKVISEPDNGLYDAINKGINQATGDVIGILNGDDYYAHDQVLQLYSDAFADERVDITFADLVYFSPAKPERTIRLYSSRQFTPTRLLRGWMPPHPTVFVRARVYEQIGCYHTDYLIAADYEFIVRALLVHQLNYRRIDSIVVRMQIGGISTSGLRATYTLNKEIIRACRENGFDVSWPRLLAKYPAKLKELLIRE